MSGVHPVTGIWVKTPTGIHPVAAGGTVTPSPVAPGAPTNVEASSIGQTTVTVTWTASTVPDGGTLANYRLYRDGTYIGSTLSLSYVFGGLTADTGYVFGVSAISDDGYESAITTVVAQTAPIPPAGPAMYVGAWIKPGTAAEWARVEGLLNRSLNIRRSYTSNPISGTLASSAAGMDIGKRAIWYSFKGDLGTMRDGGYTSALNTFLASVPSGQVLYLTFRHEPENDKNLDLPTYRAALRRFYTDTKAARASTTVVQPLYMGHTFRTSSGRNPDDWYPGNAYTDAIGVDIYNPYKLPALGNTTQWLDNPMTHLIAFRNYCAAKGKPWGVGEWGCAEDETGIGPSRKALWLRTFADYCAPNNCFALCYFSSSKADDTNPTIVIESSAQSLDSFRYIIDTYGG